MRSLILCLIVFLAGCGMIPRAPVPQPDDNIFVEVVLLDAKAEDRGFDVWVEFEEWTRHAFIVQEVELNNGDTLVECFQTPNGRFPMGQKDHHWKETAWPKHWRKMTVYPATVEGADLTMNGFAMLPENRDGSVKTTVGDNFNKKYRWKGKRNPDTGEWENKKEYGVLHEVRGQIVADAKYLAVTWHIDYYEGKLTIVLPDGDTHEFFDPDLYN